VGLTKELEADLIVMGCRGRHETRRIIDGSVSDAFIRHAPCPILVVRSGENAKILEQLAHSPAYRFPFGYDHGGWLPVGVGGGYPDPFAGHDAVGCTEPLYEVG
jgi:hypothetical protein